MSGTNNLARNWLEQFGGWGSPFTAPVPVPVRDRLIALQSERLHAILPLLCLTIAACAVAMTLAVLGDLPWWQQFAPPFIIIGSCLTVLVRSHGRGRPAQNDAALRQFRIALWSAAGLGLLSGLWCVNAFTETERYYCMVAPVFIGIAALVTATCLMSVPRAAIAGIIATVSPIVIKIAFYDNLGVRAMAVMLVVVGVMQGGIVLAKFRETVAMLELQHELNRLAESDFLTGLDNRLSFMRKLDERLSRGAPSLVALADLDGFKLVNDHYGHQAGDAILVEVAQRMRMIAVSAISVARLGGDEFALLFDATERSGTQIGDEIMAVAATVPLPCVHGDTLLSVGLSIGTAKSPADGADSIGLLAAADVRLYANKAMRKQKDAIHSVG